MSQGLSKAETKWWTLVNAAQPCQGDPIQRGFIKTPTLRSIVRNHVGARSCPASVSRDKLLEVAVQLRLVTVDDASREARTATVQASASQPKGKRKRDDRADKLKRRKVVKKLTVKCALRSRVRAEGGCDKAFRIVQQLQKRVEAYSRRMVNASLAMSGIVKGIFESCRMETASETESDVAEQIVNTPVPSELFTQTFVRQLLLGTEDASIPSQLAASYHRDHPRLLLSGFRHLSDRNIYSAGAIQYLTNLKNAFRTQLFARIKTACRRLGLPKGMDAVVRYCIHGWSLPPSFGCCLPQPEAFYNVVRLHRRVLGLADHERITDKWIESDANLPSMLRYNVFLNKMYQDTEGKLFNIVPICSVRAHFIRVDTSVLYGVLRDAGVISRELSWGVFDKLRDVFWPDTINLRGLMPRGYDFGWSVTTDGVSMCATFETTQVVSTATGSQGGRSSDEYKPEPGDVVVGNDPGRTNIYYMAGVVGGQTKVLKLTRHQYYTESGVLTARQNTERWTRAIQPHLDALSEASTKGASSTAHEWYLDRFDRHQEALWTEYLRPRWARQRLSLYGGKKRVFANFFNRLSSLFAGGRLVVAYGNGKFGSGGVGETSVPTTRAYKECASRVVTHWTDEFRTSKIDCQDDSVLQLLTTMVNPGRALRGLLYNPSERRFVSRDLNAALNIRRLLLGPRPTILCRKGVVQKLEQKVVKTVKAR